MQIYQTLSRAVLTLGFVSLIAVAGSASAYGLYFQDDGKATKQEDNKSEKRTTVKVITSGKPVVIERSKGRRVIGNHSHSSTAEQSSDRDGHTKHSKEEGRRFSYSFGGSHDTDASEVEAIKSVRQSLDVVEKRLKKTKKRSEKEALEAAQLGLKTALEALKARHSQYMQFIGPEGLGLYGHDLAMVEIFKDIEIDRGDVRSLRIEIPDHIHGLREILSEALGSRYELGIDEFEGGAEGRLEALRRAEDGLKHARKTLEKHLAEKKAKEDNER